MKAITLAAFSALAIVGTACSQAAPEASAEAKTAAAELTPAAAPADDGFNLRMPGESGADAVADDGFNLQTPDLSGFTADDGFNLPDNLPRSGGLQAIPEIDTSLLTEADAEAAPVDEDEIIRIEP